MIRQVETSHHITSKIRTNLFSDEGLYKLYKKIL
jgi:hypothetical protein